MSRPRHSLSTRAAQAARQVFVPPEPSDNDGEIQKEFVEKMLNGTQAKTAFALRFNAERMITEDGLNSIGFMTLTVGDTDEATGAFDKVFDSDEASRRFNNLNRRVLKEIFERAIVVTERHKDGSIHFHILGTLRGRPDIRTGIDFEQIKRRDYRSASEGLRALWAYLRVTLPDYGFGRAETLPVRKTGAAVASYVSKYIEKNVCNRLKTDKGKKLVRYIGWDGSQLKPNAFGWATKRSTAWRLKTKDTFALANINDPDQAAAAIGPRWAWHVSKLWSQVSDEVSPGLIASFEEKNLLRRELVRLNEHYFARKERDAEEWARRGSFADELLECPEFRAWADRGNTTQTEDFNTLAQSILNN